ncbi:hypothetical protein J4558_00785 [Leptolyngbya sp. 15MV]|nr:hypothetical protein J4558_00785 [Leptolyngbya sp. 15MV]
MTDDHAPEIDPADAFEEVRRELSMLTSAIQGLTAAREKAPDYSVTLGEISARLETVGARLANVEQSRALSLSPAALAKELEASTAAVRAEDRKMLVEARDALTRSLGRVDGMIDRGQAVECRIARERKIGVVGLMAGMLLWAVLPGMVIRSLPESWLAPEWAASRIMGMAQADAGKRLWQTARHSSVPETDQVEEGVE